MQSTQSHSSTAASDQYNQDKIVDQCISNFVSALSSVTEIPKLRGTRPSQQQCAFGQKYHLQKDFVFNLVVSNIIPKLNQAKKQVWTLFIF